MTDVCIIRGDGALERYPKREACKIGVFQYDPAFVGAGIETAPLQMTATRALYQFPALGWDWFIRSPGMRADALADLLSAGTSAGDARARAVIA